MIYDYVICGGGSAGSVLANRLSAKSGNKVLLLEAGQDTPHGKVPAAVLDSYPGVAYLNPNFTWNQLKVTTEVISHNNPDAPRPPLRPGRGRARQSYWRRRAAGSTERARAPRAQHQCRECRSW